jgi:hypothetical protein
LYVNTANGTANGTAYLNVSQSNETIASGLAANYQTAAIDWTQDQYIVFTATLGNIANSAWIAGSSFSNIGGGQGINGTSGTSGAQGPIGPQGPPDGTSGTSGTSGTAGTSGINGSQGPSGSSGTSGISPAQPGLVNGTGTNSLKSADFLTDLDPIASETNAIAIGNGAEAKSANSVCIGSRAVVDDNGRPNTVVIGSGSNQTKAAQYSTAIGSEANAVGAYSEAIGFKAFVGANGAIAIGGASAPNSNGTRALAENAIALGSEIEATTPNTLTTRLIQSALTIDKNFPNDVDAAAGGIPVGGFYHHNGNLKIRLT